LPDERNEPRDKMLSVEKELSDLQRASAQLRTKIVEARVRHDMPVDPSRAQERPDAGNDDRHDPSH